MQALVNRDRALLKNHRETWSGPEGWAVLGVMYVPPPVGNGRAADHKVHMALDTALGHMRLLHALAYHEDGSIKWAADVRTKCTTRSIRPFMDYCERNLPHLLDQCELLSPRIPYIPLVKPPSDRRAHHVEKRIAKAFRARRKLLRQVGVAPDC